MAGRSRRKFDDGVEKFRAAGKDLYSLPWYLLVGPAGSARPSRFVTATWDSPGLQDHLQGAGGTFEHALVVH